MIARRFISGLLGTGSVNEEKTKDRRKRRDRSNRLQYQPDGRIGKGRNLQEERKEGLLCGIRDQRRETSHVQRDTKDRITLIEI